MCNCQYLERKEKPSFAEYQRKFRGGAGNSRQEANNLEQRSFYRGFRTWPRRHRITDLDKAEFQSAGGLPNCFSLNTGFRFAKCCDCFLSVEVNRSFGPLKLTSKVTKSKSVNIP